MDQGIDRVCLFATVYIQQTQQRNGLISYVILFTYFNVD